MPDYDPNSIPILDDIIEEEAKKSKHSKTATADSEKDLTDSSLELFKADAAAPSIGDVDYLADPTETAESALMDFQPDDNSDLGIHLQPGEVQPGEVQHREVLHGEVQHEDDQQHEVQQYDGQAIHELLMDDIVIESTEKIPAQYIDIDAIVDEIIYQLMPDLEQNIRALVQQTLEEKLPAELIKPAPPKNNN